MRTTAVLTGVVQLELAGGDRVVGLPCHGNALASAKHCLEAQKPPLSNDRVIPRIVC